jgi:DNA-binding PadR family transcriptional regulator
MGKVRITVAVAVILRVFLEDPGKDRHGYELMKLTQFPSGKLYPILARLQRETWLLREPEKADHAVQGGRVRYMYRINPDCAEEIRQELAEVTRLISASAPTARRPADESLA